VQKIPKWLVKNVDIEMKFVKAAFGAGALQMGAKNFGAGERLLFLCLTCCHCAFDFVRCVKL